MVFAIDSVQLLLHAFADSLDRSDVSTTGHKLDISPHIVRQPIRDVEFSTLDIPRRQQILET